MASLRYPVKDYPLSYLPAKARFSGCGTRLDSQLFQLCDKKFYVQAVSPSQNDLELHIGMICSAFSH